MMMMFAFGVVAIINDSVPIATVADVVVVVADAATADAPDVVDVDVDVVIVVAVVVVVVVVVVVANDDANVAVDDDVCFLCCCSS